MRGQAGASSKEIKTVEELEKFIDNDDYSIVGFFEKETKLKDSFVKLADMERERYRFAHTNVKAVLDKYKFNE